MNTITVTRGYSFDAFSGSTLPVLKSSDPILNNMPLRGSRETTTLDPVKLIAEMNVVRAANGRPLIVLV